MWNLYENTNILCLKMPSATKSSICSGIGTKATWKTECAWWGSKFLTGIGEVIWHRNKFRSSVIANYGANSHFYVTVILNEPAMSNTNGAKGD